MNAIFLWVTFENGRGNPIKLLKKTFYINLFLQDLSKRMDQSQRCRGDNAMDAKNKFSLKTMF
jgi:hypothetical protein